MAPAEKPKPSPRKAAAKKAADPSARQVQTKRQDDYEASTSAQQQDRDVLLDARMREIEVRSIDAAREMMKVLNDGLKAIHSDLIRSLDLRLSAKKRWARVSTITAVIAILLVFRVERNRVEALEDSCRSGNALRTEITTALTAITGEPIIPGRDKIATFPEPQRSRLIGIHDTIDSALDGNLQARDCRQVVDDSQIPAPWPLSLVLHVR